MRDSWSSHLAGRYAVPIRAEGLTHTPRINSEILNSTLFARMSIVFRHGSLHGKTTSILTDFAYKTPAA
jgi:hypothetical protein